jgi:hypothetical protein
MKELGEQDFTSHIKEMLCQATDEFLAKEHSLIDDNRQDRTGHMKLWIHRAIDIIMDATAFTPDDEKPFLEDFLKAAEDCSEAIAFAFQ